ncbi:MAG: hypothetical protein ACREBK_03735, partial [Sphingomicrobium sp.]
MIELLSANPILRALLLAALFAIVAATAYFSVQSVIARQLTRRRLQEAHPQGHGQELRSSLRTQTVESTWLKLVNSIESKGLSLVDTKDISVRRQLVAAGFAAPYAPRVYT